MIQILKKQGWLVMAAALTIGLSACSSDDIATDGLQLADGAKGLTITVGAGFADDASTRSAVVYDNTAKTRTLTFTSGDRLFVYGTVGEEQTDEEYEYLTYYNYMFYGMLNMVEGSLSKDSKSAKFTGDLTFLTPKRVQYTWEMEGEGETFSYYTYEYEKKANAVADFEGKDPLGMSTDVEAHLIHKDAVEDKDFFVEITEPVSLWNIFSFQFDLAADVSTLMTTMLDVGNFEEAYDAENKTFKLVTNSGPIFNCTISGLMPNTTYRTYYSGSLEEFFSNFLTPIKTDANGKATFAFFGNKYQTTHVLKFEPLDANGEVDTNGYVMLVDLGEKELSSTTVYNITTKATAEGQGFETPGDGGNW